MTMFWNKKKPLKVVPKPVKKRPVFTRNGTIMPDHYCSPIDVPTYSYYDTPSSDTGSSSCASDSSYSDNSSSSDCGGSNSD